MSDDKKDKQKITSVAEDIATIQAMSERFTDEACPVEEEAMDEDDFVQAGIVAREIVKKKTAMQSAQEWIEKNPDWGTDDA